MFGLETLGNIRAIDQKYIPEGNDKSLLYYSQKNNMVCVYLNNPSAGNFSTCFQMGSGLSGPI